MSDLTERFETLRTAYQELEGRYYALMAASGVSIDGLDEKRRELSVWAASEAARWMDPRAGSGPTSEIGLKLREIAGVLARSA